VGKTSSGHIQTGLQTHPFFCTMGNYSHSRCYIGQGMKLTTLNFYSQGRESEEVYLCLHLVLAWQVTRQFNVRMLAVIVIEQNDD